ncbi:MAG: MFS transporter, partial [Anaerolineae bacterium]
MVRPLSAYYGWRIVGALAITQLVSWGILYYAFSVVLLPMQLDTGWDTAAITGAFSLGLVIGGVAALPIGRLLDRFG